MIFTMGVLTIGALVLDTSNLLAAQVARDISMEVLYPTKVEALIYLIEFLAVLAGMLLFFGVLAIVYANFRELFAYITKTIKARMRYLFVYGVICVLISMLSFLGVYILLQFIL